MIRIDCAQSSDGSGLAAQLRAEARGGAIAAGEPDTEEMAAEARSSQRRQRFAGGFFGRSFSKFSNESASRGRLSQRMREMRGKRMATPDLWRVERCKPSKALDRSTSRIFYARVAIFYEAILIAQAFEQQPIAIWPPLILRTDLEVTGQDAEQKIRNA